MHSPRFEAPSIRKIYIFGVLTILVALIPLLSSRNLPAMPMDEAILLVYPEQISHGKLPYRDFESVYPPGNILTLAGIYSIFGEDISVERAVGLIYRALLLLGIFLLASRVSLAAAVIGTFMACTILLPIAPCALSWLGALALALGALILLANDRQANWRAPISGIIIGWALLFRLDLAPALVLAAIPNFLLLSSKERVLFCGGIAIGLIPLAVITAMVGFSAIAENLFILPVLVESKGRHLPLFTVPRPLLALFIFHLTACIINLAASVSLLCKSQSSGENRGFLSVALLAFAISQQAMQRMDIVHTACVAFLSIGILPTGITILLNQFSVFARPRYSRLLVSFVAAAAPLLLFGIMPDLLATLKPRFTTAFSLDDSRDTSVHVKARQYPLAAYADPAQKIMDFLVKYSRPGQRIFVGPGDLRYAYATDSFFYYLTPWLTPATYYLEMNPLSPNREGSRLLGDVKSADWILLNASWQRTDKGNLSNLPGPNSPNEAIQTDFAPCLAAPPFRLYVTKRLAHQPSQ